MHLVNRLSGSLSAYERLIALRIAGRLVAGETYDAPIGPRRHRVVMLAAALACRIERNASVGTVLS